MGYNHQIQTCIDNKLANLQNGHNKLHNKFIKTEEPKIHFYYEDNYNLH